MEDAVALIGLCVFFFFAVISIAMAQIIATLIYYAILAIVEQVMRLTRYLRARVLGR